MKFFRWLLVLIVLLALGAGYVAYELTRPYATFTGEVFLDFPKGTTTAEMANLLENAGVIPHAWEFLLVRGLRPHLALQAGEYRFAKAESVLEVYDRIARGDVFYFTLVVPEGQDMFDIAAASAKLGVFPAADFLRAARNPSSIRDLDPAAPTLEGYLFPSSYRLDRHTT